MTQQKEQIEALGLKQVKAYIESDKPKATSKAKERKERHREKMRKEGRTQVNVVVMDKDKEMVKKIAHVMNDKGWRGILIRWLIRGS